MVYDATKPPLPETPEQLQARIPGWGADLDHADRPAFPREQPDLVSGAHWDFPDRQPELQPRERSMEHKFLTPVFGTSSPTKGLSGALRNYAYARYSEARAAHWLILLAADRVDAVESHLASLLTLRPDNPVTETGVLSEFRHHPIASRFGQRRADLTHQPLDPVIVAGPWVAAAGLGYLAVRRFRRG
jgi:hypothetical protein